MSIMPNWQPHQQRVVEEKKELDIKLGKLTEFLKGDLFKTIPAPEQVRLTCQRKCMEDYSAILADRIAHF